MGPSLCQRRERLSVASSLRWFVLILNNKLLRSRRKRLRKMSLWTVSDMESTVVSCFKKHLALIHKDLQLWDGQRSSKIIYYSCADILDSPTPPKKKSIKNLRSAHFSDFWHKRRPLVAFAILIFSDVHGDAAYVTSPHWLHHTAHQWLVVLLQVRTLGKGGGLSGQKNIVPA